MTEAFSCKVSCQWVLTNPLRNESAAGLQAGIRVRRGSKKAWVMALPGSTLVKRRKGTGTDPQSSPKTSHAPEVEPVAETGIETTNNPGETTGEPSHLIST